LSGRDFAQAQVRSYETKPPQPEGGAKSILLVFMALLLLTGSFVGGFWLGRDRGMQAATGEVRAELEAQLHQQQQELAKLHDELSRRAAGAENSGTDVGDLTFYNELPRQAVVPAPLQSNQPAAEKPDAQPVAEKPAAAPATMQDILAQELQQRPPAAPQKSAAATTAPASAQQGTYLLQVGSFQRRQDAERFSTKFTPLGMTPLVREVQLSGRGTWYRVYVGGFASKAAAEEARQRVQRALKIEGLVVKNG